MFFPALFLASLWVFFFKTKIIADKDWTINPLKKNISNNHERKIMLKIGV